MADQRAIYEEILRVEATMTGDPPYFVTSVTNLNTAGGVTAGRICDVPVKRQAARLVATGTHRISTPAEIQQFHAELKAAGEVYAKIAMDRKQQFALPEDLQALIRLAVEKQKEKK